MGSIWRPKSGPKRPPRAPKRSPRDAQNALKTIFVSKTLIFQKSMNVLAESRFLRFRRSSLELKIDPKRPQERIRNSFEEAKPRRSKKKDTRARKRGQRETQERPKSEDVRAWQLFGVDLEAPKGSQ